jgi:hypothetical protein
MKSVLTKDFREELCILILVPTYLLLASLGVAAWLSVGFCASSKAYFIEAISSHCLVKAIDTSQTYL